MKQQFDPKDIDAKWRKIWEEKQIYKAPEIKEGDEKSYILDMYPYPSGSGLHVGHPRGYLGTDVYARYQRMKGKKVLHPIGFDSFGLPAENYAIKSGVHPQKTTDEAIEMFKSQIENIGLSYDWSRELSSHTPEYYKWTQWIFLQLYKKGIAYKKKAPVNWCPKDQTVLANEQVLADGTCERCGTEVIQKELEQWFFKITDYADRLIEGLDRIDWPESTKLGQKNWIGRSEGAIIEFGAISSQSSEVNPINVFTTRADTIYSGAFIVVAPEHKWLQVQKSLIKNFAEVEKYIDAAKSKTDLERQQQKDKSGVLIEGVIAVNPANNKEIPIYVGDFVLGGYGTGAVFGDVHDDRDFEFVKKFNIDAKPSIIPEDPEQADKVKNLEICFTDYGILIDSGEFSGMRSEEAIGKIIDKLEKEGKAKRQINYRLRDWLVSRQRYWGSPIPIVYDPEGNAHPVDEADLPVLIPHDVDFQPTGESPLASSKEFVERAEEKYGKGWRYEVDTMDTFVDSSWYFFRFADVHNEKEFASTEKMNAWMPVDLYVGGAEHTVLHLMYARFLTKVFYDMGIIDFDEPFQKLRHQGMILAEDNRKMSKRWGNTIDPNTEIEKYGADTLRMYEMFMGPFDSTMPWNTKTEIGVFRFLGKIWDLQDKVGDQVSDAQTREVHKLAKKVTKDIESMSFNTAIAKMMEFVNFIYKEETIDKKVWEMFLKILAPFASFVTEELWSRLGNEFSIHNQQWPEYDEKLTVDEKVKIAVQVNGKLRGAVEIASGSEQQEVEAMAKDDQNVKKYLVTDPKKVIFVKDRIINFIV